MTDLERFFSHLVRTLATIDPARLRQPIPLAEIRGIIPYRTSRGALQLDTSEDYDLLLMRLCAGEGGFARTSPEEVRMRFEQELASSNPHLGMLRQFADSVVSLAPEKLAIAASETASGAGWGAEVDDRRQEERRLEERRLEERATQPLTAPPATPVPNSVVSRDSADKPSTSVPCAACGEALPVDVPIKFCPYCGTSRVPARCSACNAELQPGWRFCPGCGQGV